MLEPYGNVIGHIDRQINARCENEERAERVQLLLTQAGGNKPRQTIVPYEPLVFKQDQKTEKTNGKSRLKIALSHRKQDARDNHMKDEVENQRVLNTAGEMQQSRQKQQIRAYLEIDDSLDRLAGNVRIDSRETIEPHPHNHIVHRGDLVCRSARHLLIGLHQTI